MIINVNYKNKGSGEYSKRGYSYFCTIPDIKVGDIVIAPTARGENVARVAAVGVPESKIDERVLPLLKTIERRWEDSEAVNVAETPADDTVPLEAPPEGDGEIITLLQEPVIREQLQRIKADVEQRVQTVLAMECTEATYKAVKVERAKLNKEYNALEQRRKEVKAAILAPYEQFEQVYRSCAGDIYAAADTTLKSRIAEVEGGLRREKSKEILAYFNEYRAAMSIPADLVDFARTGIKITLSDSAKALKTQVKDFLDRVASDLSLIALQDSCDEITLEYAKTLNAAHAIMTVKKRHEALEEERKRREEAASHKAAAEAAQKAVEDIVAAPPAPVAAPTPTRIVQEALKSKAERVFSTSFKVRGTMEQLKALKNFLSIGGYEYEQL